MRGTRSATVKIREAALPRIKAVSVQQQKLTVYFNDGRVLSLPMRWLCRRMPRLNHGTPAERENVVISGAGHGLFWPDLNDDIDVEWLLLGGTSMESPESFARWIDSYEAGDVYRDVPTYPLGLEESR